MKRIRLTTDAVIIDGSRILLIKRDKEPFRGKWALPGGHVEYGEKVEDAAIREAKEETGVDINLVSLLGVYSDPKRDPRSHSVAIAFICRPKTQDSRPLGGDDASEAKWWPLGGLPKLAFDHALMVSDARKVQR